MPVPITITYSKTGKLQKQIVIYPILDWSLLDIWVYILVSKIEVSSAYNKGFMRVGCYPCPFNNKWGEYLIKNYYKNEFEKWNKVLIRYAERTGKNNPVDYVEKGIWERKGRWIRNRFCTGQKYIRINV